MSEGTMSAHEQEALDRIRDAVQDWTVRFEIGKSLRGHDYVRVYQLQPNNRWHKIEPVLFPPEDGNLGDLLKMLADMRAEAD